jgi:hypothetical protein
MRTRGRLHAVARPHARERRVDGAPRRRLFAAVAAQQHRKRDLVGPQEVAWRGPGAWGGSVRAKRGVSACSGRRRVLRAARPAVCRRRQAPRSNRAARRRGGGGGGRGALTKQLLKHALRHLHVARLRARRNERGRGLRVGLHAEARQARELLDCLLDLALRAERLDAARRLSADLADARLVGQLRRRRARCGARRGEGRAVSGRARAAGGAGHCSRAARGTALAARRAPPHHTTRGGGSAPPTQPAPPSFPPPAAAPLQARPSARAAAARRRRAGRAPPLPPAAAAARRRCAAPPPPAGRMCTPPARGRPGRTTPLHAFRLAPNGREAGAGAGARGRGSRGVRVRRELALGEGVEWQRFMGAFSAPGAPYTLAPAGSGLARRHQTPPARAPLGTTRTRRPPTYGPPHRLPPPPA